MKKSIPLLLAALLAPTLPLSAQLIVDDSWADGDRTMTEDPETLDADWWSANDAGANSIEVETGALGLVTGSTGRGIHGTFPAQTLAVGDTLVATATFTTPATVGVDKGTAFKISMMELTDPGLAADLRSNSQNPQDLYLELPGYMVDFDVNKADMSDNISVREHNNPNTTGRFMGTTGEWSSLGNSPDDAGGYSIAANTEYVAIMSLTRTGDDTMDISASLSQGGTLLDSVTVADDTGMIANNIGMLGFWANSNTFGSDSAIGNPDNGIDFSHITVELNPQPPFVSRIIDIDYDGDAGSVTIEWTAEVDTTYFVFASNDLGDFLEELGDVTAEGATATFTESGVSAGRRFYRVVELGTE